MRVLLHILVMAVAGAVSPRSSAAEGPPPVPTGAAAARTAVTHVDAARGSALIDSKSVVVLDIRTPGEFQAGHIAGARNIDFRADDFEKKLRELSRGQTYLVHCQTGRRSTNALETFKKLGFEKVVHLDGGYRDWEKAGKPVEK